MSEEIELVGNVMAVSHDPKGEIAYAVKCAKALGEVMANKPDPVVIKGERYLEIDDWTMLGHFFGISPTVDWTRPMEFGTARGWEARARAIHRATGAEISAAEAMCLNDEDRWSTRWNGKTKANEPVPMHQLRSMAQTRAQSKALAGALRWVAQLGNFKTTPAEEVDEGTIHENAPEAARPKPASAAPEPAPADAPSAAATNAVTVLTLKKVSSGTNPDGGSWILTAVLTSDEQKYVCFDQVLPALTEAHKRKIPVFLTTKPPRKAGGDPQIIEVQFVP